MLIGQNRRTTPTWTFFGNMITTHTRESLIAFEQKVQALWESGEAPSLLHLSGGNEGQLLDIFKDIRPQDWIFVSHRAHFHLLLKGFPEEPLLQLIREDRHMFCYSRELRIYQSAILGGTVGIAVGVAKAIQESGEDAHVYVFMGDGAEEGGALHPAALYATGHRLPITFIVEDNDRQVDTSKQTRRGERWEWCQLTAPCIVRYSYKPTWPHAGSGANFQIQFKRTTPL
jgi:TPP-dependent pyruvate/acetoin dehydrogenase alpha subunit